MGAVVLLAFTAAFNPTEIAGDRRSSGVLDRHMTPEAAPPDWRPMFVDYLYLGFANALAFSPTDTMLLAPLAKFTMGTTDVRLDSRFSRS